MPSTLGTPAKRKWLHVMRESVNWSADAKKVFVPGEPVQLASDGDVDSVTVPQKTMGYVYKPNKVIGEPVTIITSFMTVIRAQASGTVATGDLVKIDAAASQTAGKPVYVTAASTNVALGICLAGATTGLEITVGTFYAPVLAP